MMVTTLGVDSGARGATEEPDERDGGIVELNRDKPIIDVEDVPCTGNVDDVERIKVCDVQPCQDGKETWQRLRSTCGKDSGGIKA